MDEQRIKTIKDYISSYANKFPEADLIVQLKSAGYSENEINFAKSSQYPIQQQNNSNDQSFQVSSKKPFNKKKAIKIAIIISAALIFITTSFWAINTFLVYKGIKVGSFEINKELANTDNEGVVLKIGKLESSKEKIKLYVSVENNLDDSEYYIYGDLLGSIKIKDQNGKILQDFKKDGAQEMGGDLKSSYITFQPGDISEGWVSFVNPDDRKVDLITIEISNNLFKKSELIKL